MGVRTKRRGRGRATTAASDEPSWPPSVVVASALSNFEGLSASPASSQRRDAATFDAPDTVVDRCRRPPPPIGSFRPAVAVVGASPRRRRAMVRRFRPVVGG